MQFAAPPSIEEVSLKVVIQSGGSNQLIKRLTVKDCCFTKLKETIEEWVPGGSRIQYVDEDDDLIEVSSDEEWFECIRHTIHHLKKKNILLKVKRLKQPCAPAATAVEEVVASAPLITDCLASAPEIDSQSTEPVILQQVSECQQMVSDDQLAVNESNTPVAETQIQSSLSQSAAIPDSPENIETPVHLNRSAMQPTVVAILRFKYGRECLDSEEQRTQINQQEDWVVVQGTVPELTLDVDIPKLRQFINSNAMRCIAIGEVENSFRWLTLGLVIFPTYDVFYYNMACASCVSGDLPSALTSIQLAVQNGYRSVQHLEQDSDLEAVRSHPQFQEVLMYLRQLENEVFQYERQLSQLKEMGIDDSPSVKQLLNTHNGDLAKVLEVFLSQ